MNKIATGRRLISDAQVGLRYGKHVSTLKNWDATSGLGFPPPIYIRKRKYRDADELDAFDRKRAAEREPEPLT